jgi:hypothetical protein
MPLGNGLPHGRPFGSFPFLLHLQRDLQQNLPPSSLLFIREDLNPDCDEQETI